MKIGILTLPLHINYGGILQAYAMQTVLERMGHDVSIIEISKIVPSWIMCLRVSKRILIKYLLGKRDTKIFVEKEKIKEFNIVSQYTSKFIAHYIHRRTYRSYNCIRESDYNAIIVGSDQVWRPEYFGSFINHAFLDFAQKWKGIKRISYAASFGTDEWLYSKQQELENGQLIKLFDAISVREVSAVEICKKYWNVDAVNVLDPTLLLSREDYEKIVTVAKTPPSPGNLLCYVLDEDERKNRIINDIASKKNLNPFRTNTRCEISSVPLSNRIQPPLEQWLRGFMDAEFVVTDSFHATVFSIIFKKEFIVISNKNRGITRLTSFLGQLGLESRLIKDDSEISDLDSIIEWDRIYKKLQSLRIESINFLKSNLA